MSLAEKMTIKWEKNGYLIEKETFDLHNKEENTLTSDLVVDIIDESDFGGFRCIAENEIHQNLTHQQYQQLSHL